MTKPSPRYVAFTFFNVTPKWLSLTKDERRAFRDRCFGPVFVRAGDRVRIRLFDMWPFSNRATDVLMCETHELDAFYELMNELKETELFSRGFIERTEVFLSVEDDFLSEGEEGAT